MSMVNKKGLLCPQEKLEDSPFGKKKKKSNSLRNGLSEMLKQLSWFLIMST